MQELEVLESEGPDQTRILALKGPLVLNTLFEFQKLVRGVDAPRLIIDLSGVPYMDSAGLGVLLGALASSQRHGRKFALAGVPDRIRVLFAVSQVESMLPQYDTLAAAQAHVSASAATA